MPLLNVASMALYIPSIYQGCASALPHWPLPIWDVCTISLSSTNATPRTALDVRWLSLVLMPLTVASLPARRVGAPRLLQRHSFARLAVVALGEC